LSPAPDAERSGEPTAAIGDSPARSPGKDARTADLTARERAVKRLGVVEAAERADEVMTFIAGHVAAQNRYGAIRGVPLAEWIARLGDSLGEAAALAARAAVDERATRAMAASLASAAADGLLAGAELSERWTPESRHEIDGELRDLAAGLVVVRLVRARWSPATQLAFAYREFGKLCNAATPLLADDPAALKERPPLGALLDEAMRDALPTTPEPDPAHATGDPVEEVLFCLEEFALRSGEAAVLVHPGGTFSADP
jgi:hypothetical protein